MSTLQKWLALMAALGAGYLILTNPKGALAAGQAIRNTVGGTESDIISGGAK